MHNDTICEIMRWELFLTRRSCWKMRGKHFIAEEVIARTPNTRVSFLNLYGFVIVGAAGYESVRVGLRKRRMF